MQDIIHLLSDAVANQIAAGEVVQRPASAVKELLENAIDAGATQIQLIIKDAGRTLIQVVDNGKGMSFNDARLCFDRHATSKITSSQDLFTLRTKGFRGEALASIAAIAQVELKTKPADQDLGTIVIAEGSTIKEHAPTATPNGTNISVKNLFFNVPARRNFLKSDAIEFGHIEEEFFRIVLIHNEINFSLYHNGKLLYQLTESNFKQRIINTMGSHFKEKLYPVEQDTDTIKISGFIAKPENAKKKKSEQYLFINNRYVRHYLLAHAVESAYKDLIPEGYKPAFFLKIEVDPATIDVNISPTKIEVKLQDERLVYGFLQATVKKSIGMLTLTPQIDFDIEPGLDVSKFKEKTDITPPKLTLNPNYNPFNTTGNKAVSRSYSPPKEQSFGNWDQFIKELKTTEVKPTETEIAPTFNYEEEKTNEASSPEKEQVKFWEEENFSAFCYTNKFLIFLHEGNIALVNIPNARERILYENYLNAMENTPVVIQQSLFPETIKLSPSAAEVVREIKTELLQLGYDLEQIDNTSFAINGTPNNEEEDDIQLIIENLVSSYQSHLMLHRDSKQQSLALSLAKQKRHFYKTPHSDIEQKDLLRQLFSTSLPYTSPSGKKIMHIFTLEAIQGLFQ